MKKTLFDLKSPMKPVLSRPMTRSQSPKSEVVRSSLSRLELSLPPPKLSKKFESSTLSYLERLIEVKQSIDTSSIEQDDFNNKISKIDSLTTKTINELIHETNSTTNHFLALFHENCHVLNLILSTPFNDSFKLMQLETIVSSMTSAFNLLLSKLLPEHHNTTIIKTNSFKPSNVSYFYPFNENYTISKSDMFQFVSLYKTILDEFPLEHRRKITTMFSDIVSYYLIDKVSGSPFKSIPGVNTETTRVKRAKKAPTNRDSPFKFIQDNEELYCVDINIDNLIDLVTFHKDSPKKYLLVFLKSLINLNYTSKETKIKELTKRLLEETFTSHILASNIIKHLFSIHNISSFKEELELLITFTFKGCTNILSSQYNENFVYILTLLIKQLQIKTITNIFEIEYNAEFKNTICQCVLFLNSTYNKPSIVDLNILCLGVKILEDEELLLNNSILNLLQIEKIILIKIRNLNEQKNKTLNLDLYYKIINKLTNVYYNKKSNKRKIILSILLNINFIIQFYFNNIFIVLDFINSVYPFETSLVQSIIKQKLCEVKLSDNTILYTFLYLKNLHFSEYKTLQITEEENLNVKFSKLYLTNQHTNSLYDPVIMTAHSILKRINDQNIKSEEIDVYYITEVKRMLDKVISVVNYSKHKKIIPYLNKEALNTLNTVLLNNKEKDIVKRDPVVLHSTSKLLKKWLVFYIKAKAIINDKFNILDTLRKNLMNNFPITDLALTVYKEFGSTPVKNDILDIILKWLLHPNNICISTDVESILYNFALFVKYMNVVQKDDKMTFLLTARLETILNTLNKSTSILTTPDNIILIQSNQNTRLLLKILLKEVYKLISSKYLYLNFSFSLVSLLTFVKRVAKEYIPYTDVDNIKFVIKSLIFLYESSILVPRSESKKVTELVFFKSDFELRIIVQLYITQLLKVQKNNYEGVLKYIIYAPFSTTFGMQTFTFNTLKNNFREFLNVYYKVDLISNAKEAYNYKYILGILESIIDKFLDCVIDEKYADLEKYILSVIITFYEILKLKNVITGKTQKNTKSKQFKNINIVEFEKELENSILRPFMAVGDLLCSLETEDDKTAMLVDCFIAFSGCIYKNHRRKNILYKLNKLINTYLDGSNNKKEADVVYKFKNVIIDIIII